MQTFLKHFGPHKIKIKTRVVGKPDEIVFVYEELFRIKGVRDFEGKIGIFW